MKPTQKKSECAIIDYANQSFSADDIISFLNSKTQTAIKIIKQSVIENMLCITIPKHDFAQVIQQNGKSYNGIPLLISPMEYGKHRNEMPIISKYFHDHFYNDYLDLSDSKDRGFPMNLNYYKDFQFTLFYLGAISRRENAKIVKLNLDKNNIHRSSSLKYVKTYLPFIQSISLKNNEIADQEILDHLKQEGINILINDNDNDFDYYSEEEQEEEEEEGYDQEEEIPKNDMYHQAIPEESFRSLDHTPAPSTVKYERKEIYDFVNAFNESFIKFSNMRDFYSDDAFFSITFPQLSRHSILSDLFSNNSNLRFNSNPVQIFGSDKIEEFIDEKFKTNFEVSNLDFHVQFVSKIFFAVIITGTFSSKLSTNQPLLFSRSLVVIGKNGYLMITNDNISFYPKEPDQGRNKGKFQKRY